jgi:hypothetical protein
LLFAPIDRHELQCTCSSSCATLQCNSVDSTDCHHQTATGGIWWQFVESNDSTTDPTRSRDLVKSNDPAAIFRQIPPDPTRSHQISPAAETSARAFGPITNFRSEPCCANHQISPAAETQNHALFLFRAPDKPRPVRKETWAAEPRGGQPVFNPLGCPPQ